MAKFRRIAWLAASLDFDIASTRYRAIYPAMELEKAGWRCDLYSDYDRLLGRLREYDVLVIIKRLDAGTIRVVSEADDVGVPIILDLCDDILGRDYRARLHDLHRMTFRAIEPHLLRLVTTGPYLARSFEAFGIDSRVIREVPDCVETESDAIEGREFAKSHADAAAQLATQVVRASVSSRKYAIELIEMLRRAARAILRPRRSLRAFKAMWLEARYGGAPKAERLSASQAHDATGEAAALALPGKSVIWFGNHGGPHSDFGMLTLLRVADALRAAYARAPFTLVIVSNNAHKHKLFAPYFGVPSIFVKWSHDAQTRLLDRASVFIMPTGEDTFSLSKSSNRALLALQRGVPVVAQSLESLEPLKDCISVDDIENGLVRYLTEPEAGRLDLERARRVVENEYSLKAVGQAWASIIDDALSERRSKKERDTTRRFKLLVLIDLIQDIDIAIHVIDEARARNIEVGLIVSDAAMQHSARLGALVADRKIAPTLISRADISRLDFRWLRGADALFCPSETSAPPHAVAYYLTNMANTIGMKTFTAQHGLENIALTHRDEEFPDAVIASGAVFTWGDPATLPTWVSEDLRKRCIAAGRQRISRSSYGLIGEPPIPRGRKAVGIFENLHWARYSDAFRDNFAQTVSEVAALNPDITFVVKPHPAGRWTLKRMAAARWPDNIVVASPLDPMWEPWPAALLTPLFDAVVTTPSTAALDAAEADTPTAVFAIEKDATAYAPLPRVDDADSLGKFLEGALKNPEPFRRLGRAFAVRASIGANAAERIVDTMFSESTRTNQIQSVRETSSPNLYRRRD